MYKTDLTGKTAVVTGGGGVLCSEFSKALAKCGAKIAVLDLYEEAAKATADEINSSGGFAVPYGCDVLKRESLTEVRERILSDFGRVDILINGAGGNSPKATTDKEYLSPEDLNKDSEVKNFFNLTPEGFNFVFNLNILGTLLPTQVFAECMAESGGGCVINISSMNAYRPLTKIPAYSAAKAGVSNLTMWLAVHFSKMNIRVNAIAPGFFVTKQNEALLFDKEGNPTERTQKILAATPMGRFGSSSELIGVLLFLCDEQASSFVNGVIIPVDGGFSAYSGV
ncbi:MAG: SDR family oxidoreductase [Clostridiales bacterium]|jgi:NAD(P)-dependent dehydrogenase (short-subunit alcohol dehydrogenase family)|nr:SDR family oxidoreductase [Clostridiales bacterium]